eukprot:CAMPEP_0172313274 /NCGR_PEP_ID=MMETSP1058-20130122/19890_1 /TAXON_ID=83371 /ORGANISM="Detonula confervacea, Strain CCMP 353" /LENGTH=202 /DNA_ID=CAMNT_0013026903 /DNA_START=214 /DNA_END=822 /DNA_ORIENTATION=+
MGLLKKIKNKRSINFRRKKSAAAEAVAISITTSSDSVQIPEFQVTSNPKEYSQDSLTSFNWLTNSFDDFKWRASTSGTTGDTSSTQDDETGCGTTGDTSSTQDNEIEYISCAPIPVESRNETGWGWLASCWHPSLDTKMDNPTYQSSYSDDGSGESSQPSTSRIDQILKLPAADEISDVTSVPSIDDSDSDDSEELSNSDSR